MSKLGIPGLSINGLAYADVRLSVIPVIEASRRPTGNDKRYPLFCFWRTNKFFSGVEGEIWVLIRFDSNGDAVWTQFEGATAVGMDGLKDQDDNIVTPDMDNTVKLTGDSNIIVNQTGASELTIGLIGGIPPQQQTEVDLVGGTGVNPVVPDGMGLVRVTADYVSAHNSPIETITRAPNQWSVEVQLASTSASPANPNDVGLCSFDPTNFSVTDGWVEFIGGGGGAGEIDTIGVDAATSPGVNPVEPDGAGNVDILGVHVSNNQIPVRTHTIALNELRFEVQQATTVTPTPANRRFIGLSCYNTNQFTVDATSGMVSLAGGDITEGLLQSLTGNSGGAVFPDASANIDFVGDTGQGFVDITGTPGSNLLETKLTGLNDAELYIGNTTLGDPQVGTITSTDGSVTITYDDPNIDLSSGGITWVEETSTSRSLIAGQGVSGNNAGTITMTLPENPPIGDEFIIYQEGAGSIVIQAQGSDVIRLGTEDSTAGGNIESLNVGDNIHLVSFGSNRFRAINGWGSWSVN